MLNDEHYIRRCIELAHRAEGRTAPNPLVGSVVVSDDGTVLGEGFHAKAGMPHAEVEALNAAGLSAKGQTLYINLEPCCHHGRTPPCTDRIIASGVRRVIFGMVDPNPKVSGGGVQALEAAGIEVQGGILEQECRYLNRAFIKWKTTGLPWLCLKLASTLDGRIADRNHTSRWISGVEARDYVHRLRDKYDCMLIGGKTVSCDDPELTVRDVENSRDPVRAVMDPKLSISKDSRMCKNPDGKTWIFTAAAAIEGLSAPYPASVRLVATSLQTDGRLDLGWVLRYLGEQSLLSVLCEGGSHLAGSLLQQSLVDEVEWIIAPKMLCDSQSVSAINYPAEVTLDRALTFKSQSMQPLGHDILLKGLLTQP